MRRFWAWLKKQRDAINNCDRGCTYEPGVRGCPVHDWHKGEA